MSELSHKGLPKTSEPPRGWVEAVKSVSQSGKLLVVQRTEEGAERVNALLAAAGEDPCPRLQMTSCVFEKQRWRNQDLSNSGRNNAESAADVKTRLARLHLKTLAKLSEHHRGYYYALRPEVVDQLLTDFGAIILGRSENEDVVSLCLNREQHSMKRLAEHLSVSGQREVSRAKIAEIGGFLPVTKTMLPTGLDRTQLLAQVMCELQLICGRQQTELALAIVHTKNRAMHGVMGHMQALNPNVILNLGEIESHKDGSPCQLYGFDLVGKYGYLEQTDL